MGGGFLAGVQNAAGVVMEALQDDGVSEESDPVRRGGHQDSFEAAFREVFFVSKTHMFGLFGIELCQGAGGRA